MAKRLDNGEQAFKLQSLFEPAGDQPGYSEINRGASDGAEHQTLLGVTGSKTFTVANVIQNWPADSHNFP